MPFAFKKTPRINLSCKRAPVRYRCFARCAIPRYQSISRRVKLCAVGMRNAILGNDLNKSNQWFSVVCTLLDNDTRHHSGQNPLNHIRFVFYHNIKHNEINFLSRFVKTNTDSKCTRCIMQNSYLYDTDFPFKNFCHLSQHAETIRKNAWEKSNDANSLSIRVQTTMNHISICCLAQYQRQRK